MFLMTTTARMETVIHHRPGSTPQTTVWSGKNPDGTYDMWSGDIPLLENCTLEDITHFLQWGHSQCDDTGCDLCR